MTTQISNPFSCIEFKHLKFVIFDAPTNDNINLYYRELKKYNINCIIRVCHDTYNKETFIEKGIEFYDWPFPDGSVPLPFIIKNFIQLINKKRDSQLNIGIHCVSGLGRAPLLVAIALIEQGMEPLYAVEYIRKKRPKCLNQSQLEFLNNYKSQKGSCIIS